MLMRVFPEMFKRARKTHLEFSWDHPMSWSNSLNKKEKAG